MMKFALLKSGEIDAFALARDQLNKKAYDNNGLEDASIRTE